MGGPLPWEPASRSPGGRRTGPEQLGSGARRRHALRLRRGLVDRASLRIPLADRTISVNKLLCPQLEGRAHP